MKNQNIRLMKFKPKWQQTCHLFYASVFPKLEAFGTDVITTTRRLIHQLDVCCLRHHYNSIRHWVNPYFANESTLLNKCEDIRLFGARQHVRLSTTDSLTIPIQYRTEIFCYNSLLSIALRFFRHYQERYQHAPLRISLLLHSLTVPSLAHCYFARSLLLHSLNVTSLAQRYFAHLQLFNRSLFVSLACSLTHSFRSLPVVSLVRWCVARCCACYLLLLARLLCFRCCYAFARSLVRCLQARDIESEVSAPFHLFDVLITKSSLVRRVKQTYTTINVKQITIST